MSKTIKKQTQISESKEVLFFVDGSCTIRLIELPHHHFTLSKEESEQLSREFRRI